MAILSEMIKQFLRSRISKSPETIRQYDRNLRDFRNWCVSEGVEVLSPDVLTDFMAYLEQVDERWSNHPTKPPKKGGYSVATIHGYGRTLKVFFRWAHKKGFFDKDLAAELELPRLPRQVPRGIASGDLLEILEVAQDNPRDYAFAVFLADTGCRIAEVCCLQVSALLLDVGLAIVRGKGGDQRICPIKPMTVQALRVWLEHRNDGDSPWVFPGRYGDALTESGGYLLIKRLAGKANVKEHWNPHAWRHGFAREWLMSGGDMASLQDSLGHSDIQVTKMYSPYKIADLKKKHEKHSPLTQLFPD
jgi:integrase/recombinase XerD